MVPLLGIKLCRKVDNFALNLKPLNSALDLHCLPKTFHAMELSCPFGDDMNGKQLKLSYSTICPREISSQAENAGFSGR